MASLSFGQLCSHCIGLLAAKATGAFRIRFTSLTVRNTLLPLAARPPIPLLIALGAAGGLLAFTNPGPADFREFAGAELADRGAREFCRPGGMPMLLQMVVENCPALIRSQRQPLGLLAAKLSQRHNFGLFSLYTTRLAGGALIPQLSLPGYQLDTLAIAGQFFVLKAERSDGS